MSEAKSADGKSESKGESWENIDFAREITLGGKVRMKPISYFNCFSCVSCFHHDEYVLVIVKIGGGGVGIIYSGTFRGRPVALKTLFDPKVSFNLYYLVQRS